MATINEIRLKHPMPWVHAMVSPGEIKVRDARGLEVPLLTMLDFVAQVTVKMTAPEVPAPTHP